MKAKDWRHKIMRTTFSKTVAFFFPTRELNNLGSSHGEAT